MNEGKRNTQQLQTAILRSFSPVYYVDAPNQDFSYQRAISTFFGDSFFLNFIDFQAFFFSHHRIVGGSQTRQSKEGISNNKLHRWFFFCFHFVARNCGKQKGAFSKQFLVKKVRHSPVNFKNIQKFLGSRQEQIVKENKNIYLVSVFS